MRLSVAWAEICRRPSLLYLHNFIIIIYHSAFSVTSVAEEFSSIPDGGAVRARVGATHT